MSSCIQAEAPRPTHLSSRTAWVRKTGWLAGVLLCLAAFTQAEAQARKGVGTDRRAFFEALKRERIINPELVLLHFSHTCDLKVDGKTFHVLDVQQQLPDMPSPRGVNQLVVLDTALKPVQKLRFVAERPMRCEGSRLLVSGEFVIPGQEPGNVLVFSKGAREVTLETIQWETLKPLGPGFPG